MLRPTASTSPPHPSPHPAPPLYPVVAQQLCPHSPLCSSTQCYGCNRYFYQCRLSPGSIPPLGTSGSWYCSSCSSGAPYGSGGAAQHRFFFHSHRRSSRARVRARHRRLRHAESAAASMARAAQLDQQLGVGSVARGAVAAKSRSSRRGRVQRQEQGQGQGQGQVPVPWRDLLEATARPSQPQPSARPRSTRQQSVREPRQASAPFLSAARASIPWP